MNFKATQMHPHQLLVREFHQKFGLTINDKPTLVPEDNELRVALITEEFNELKCGVAKNDYVEIADAIADLTYVIYGTGVTYGIELGARRLPPNVPYTINLIESTERELRLLAGDLSANELCLVECTLNTLLRNVRLFSRRHSVPHDACVVEVHRSNMSKLWTEAEVADRNRSDAQHSRTSDRIAWSDSVRAWRIGNEERCWCVKRSDGKVLKSPSYSPADIDGVLGRSRQMAA